MSCEPWQWPFDVSSLFELLTEPFVFSSSANVKMSVQLGHMHTFDT